MYLSGLAKMLSPKKQLPGTKVHDKDNISACKHKHTQARTKRLVPLEAQREKKKTSKYSSIRDDLLIYRGYSEAKARGETRGSDVERKKNRKDGDGAIEQQRHEHDNDHRGTHTKRERKSCEGMHLPRLFHLFCSRLSSNPKLSHLHLIHFKYMFYFNIHCSSITSHPFFASLTILFVGELGRSQDKGPLAVNPRALLLGMPRSEGCS